MLAPGLGPRDRTRGYVVYSVLDAMASSTFDALGEVELRLDHLAASWTERSARRRARGDRSARPLPGSPRCGGGPPGAAGPLRAAGGAGRSAARLRGRGGPGVLRPARASRSTAWSASVDAAANAVGMLLDLQLNERAYLVSVVAAIFVPLTFLTGFFGMNFGWMVGQIDSAGGVLGARAGRSARDDDPRCVAAGAAPVPRAATSGSAAHRPWSSA